MHRRRAQLVDGPPPACLTRRAHTQLAQEATSWALNGVTSQAAFTKRPVPSRAVEMTPWDEVASVPDDLSHPVLASPRVRG